MMIEIEVEDSERFADESDRASKIEMDMKDEALRRQKARLEKKPDHFDGTHCIECGNEIPSDRLKTGAFRDVHCQSKHELKQRNTREYYE